MMMSGLQTPADILKGSSAVPAGLFCGLSVFVHVTIFSLPCSLPSVNQKFRLGLLIFSSILNIILDLLSIIVSENGRGRCCMGDSDRTGRLRFLLSGCYLEEIPDSACSERGMAAG